MKREQDWAAEAREKFRAMLRSMSFAERWAPVLRELGWVLTGRPDGHPKLLPDYCYGILDLYRRTLCRDVHAGDEIIEGKALPRTQPGPTDAAAWEGAGVDWRKLGSTLAVGQRALQFFEQQAAGILGELGLEELPQKEVDELEQMLGGSEVAQPGTTGVGERGRGIVGASGPEPGERLKQAGAALDEQAYASGPAALMAFKAGAADGARGFLTPDGTLRGECRLKLANTYDLLLLAWPEIQAMIQADPPQRMEDLWNWLTPFSYAGWIEIEDLDQLVSLCRPLRLKLRKPGAPRKARKC